ncbi:MAG: sulfatase-like hydrolase/transferase [Saprospiraceae bacterium]|nr:sulfatase-like hydrolase/transferase [Saprospiraceae bacterium]
MRACLPILFLFACWSVCAQPNVVIIYVDDLGYGDLSSYGHPVIQTPYLDQLANEGVKLTNYYAPSALCSPSRAGLLTARHPYRTGIESWIPEGTGTYLHVHEYTIAEALKSRGYATALIGKWHLNSSLGSREEPQPTDHGFDYSYGHNAFQIPTNRNPRNIYRNGRLLGIQEGFTAQLYADEAKTWIGGRDTSKPFFLFLSMAEPHTTIENPVAYNEQYASYTNGPIVPIRSGESEIPLDMMIPRGPGEYYANVTYMDAQIGQVLTYLEAAGIDQETIVFFASDNGPVTENWRTWWEVNAHGSTGGLRGRKHVLYEGGLKVPAIVRYPPLLKGGDENDVLMTGLDVFPTILRLAGIDAVFTNPIDGEDVTSYLLSESEQNARTLLWSLPTDNGLDHVIRQGNWKLFIDKEGQARHLYDLTRDPLELVDVFREHPSIVKELHEQWNAMHASILADPLRP